MLDNATRARRWTDEDADALRQALIDMSGALRLVRGQFFRQWYPDELQAFGSVVNDSESLAGDPDELAILRCSACEPRICFFARGECVCDLDSFDRRGRYFAKKFAKLFEFLEVIPDIKQRGRTNSKRLVLGRLLDMVSAYVLHGSEDDIGIKILVVCHCVMGEGLECKGGENQRATSAGG